MIVIYYNEVRVYLGFGIPSENNSIITKYEKRIFFYNESISSVITCRSSVASFAGIVIHLVFSFVLIICFRSFFLSALAAGMNPTFPSLKFTSYSWFPTSFTVLCPFLLSPSFILSLVTVYLLLLGYVCGMVCP